MSQSSASPIVEQPALWAFRSRLAAAADQATKSLPGYSMGTSMPIWFAMGV